MNREDDILEKIISLNSSVDVEPVKVVKTHLVRSGFNS